MRSFNRSISLTRSSCMVLTDIHLVVCRVSRQMHMVYFKPKRLFAAIVSQSTVLCLLISKHSGCCYVVIRIRGVFLRHYLGLLCILQLIDLWRRIKERPPPLYSVCQVCQVLEYYITVDIFLIYYLTRGTISVITGNSTLCIKYSKISLNSL